MSHVNLLLPSFLPSVYQPFTFLNPFFLPFFLLTFLLTSSFHSFLPLFLPFFLASFLTDVLSYFFPSFLPYFLVSILPSYLPSFHPSFLSSSILLSLLIDISFYLSAPFHLTFTSTHFFLSTSHVILINTFRFNNDRTYHLGVPSMCSFLRRVVMRHTKGIHNFFNFFPDEYSKSYLHDATSF